MTEIETGTERQARSLCLKSLSLSELADAVGRSYLSRAAEADRHLPCFDNDGDLPPVVRVFQHTLETRLVLQDIDIVEGDFTPGVVRTGLRGIGSEILSENQNLVRWHISTLLKAARIKLQGSLSLCYFPGTEGKQ